VLRPVSGLGLGAGGGTGGSNIFLSLLLISYQPLCPTLRSLVEAQPSEKDLDFAIIACHLQVARNKNKITSR
jgi:hypothetical protein